MGFAPYNKPQLLCYVIVDAPQVPDPGSSSYACRLFSSIMGEALPYMNIFPDSPEEIETTTPAPQETENQTEGETTVPLNPSEDESYEGGDFMEPLGETSAGE